MKKVVWTLAVLALTCGTVQAQDVNELVPAPGYQAPAAPAMSALDKALIANEHKINEAVAKGDKATFLSLIAPGAVSVDKGGFVPGGEFARSLDQLKVSNWKIENPQVIWIDPNSAIVTYTWTGSGTFMNERVDSPVLASTVWTKKGDKWLALFHTETAKK